MEDERRGAWEAEVLNDLEDLDSRIMMIELSSPDAAECSMCPRYPQDSACMAHLRRMFQAMFVSGVANPVLAMVQVFPYLESFKDASIVWAVALHQSCRTRLG